MDQRIAEYVDSPRLGQRMRIGNEISCVVDGNSGIYRTSLDLKLRAASWCTCPSEYVPCKHVHALRQTYKVRPRSFVDVEKVVMTKLAKKDRPALLKVIVAMARTSPPALAAVGVKGFEPPDGIPDDEEDDDDWEG